MTHCIDTFPGREILLNNKKYLYFGGTAYLGVQTDPVFQNLLIGNIKKYGTNYGASRKSNVRFSIYEDAEGYLADWVGSEACLTVSSGYLAGQLLSGHFTSDKYKLFYAPNCHSALYFSVAPDNYRDGAKIKPYTTYTELNKALREHLALNNGVTPVVFLDSIDFSGNNYPNFEGLKSLPVQDIILVADDSHGIGVVGQNEGGVFHQLSGLQSKELLVCCSLGKGLGIQAGAIFGMQSRISKLTDTNFYGGASPAAPAYMATLIQAKQVYKEKGRLLQGNIALFLNTTKSSSKFSFMEGHPTFSYCNSELTSYLKKNSIVLTDFEYPNGNATLASRIVLSASHLQNDIVQLTNLLNDYFLEQ